MQVSAAMLYRSMARASASLLYQPCKRLRIYLSNQNDTYNYSISACTLKVSVCAMNFQSLEKTSAPASCQAPTHIKIARLCATHIKNSRSELNANNFWSLRAATAVSAVGV